MARWAIDIDNIRSFYRIKPRPKRIPRLLNKFGLDNFKLDKNTLFFKGREIVFEDRRRGEIMADYDDAYGGVRVLFHRLQKKYIGLNFRYIKDYLLESERRQLKRKKQSEKNQRSFIHESRPGSLQMDLTFYHGAKIVVFGIIDVFSRWCYFEVIKDKTPQHVVAALKKAIALFKSLAPQHSIYKVASDDGSEFKSLTQEFLENYKEDPKKHPKWRLRVIRQKQPQRLIERLNGNLRQYIERVDFKNKAELTKLVARFVKERNASRHAALGTRTPLEVLQLKDRAVIKREAERQFAEKKRKVSTSGFRGLKKLTVGSLVRISLRSDKTELGHAGAKPNWTKKIYRVHRILKSRRGKDRFVVHEERSSVKKGIYFRDKLLAVSIPKRQKDQKLKYDPGAPDEEREAQQDAMPEPKWQDKKPDYKDQDERESSGEEDDVKLSEAPRPKVKKKPARKKKQPKRLGMREVKGRPLSDWVSRTVILEGERGVALDVYKGYLVIYFTKGNYIYPAKPAELDRTDWQRNPMSAKWIKGRKEEFKKHIQKAKKEVDEEEAAAKKR